ncbi:MAG TPA: hypothetical protein GX509_08980 [Firmicutes bacterium]|nr:hypothetical protein [Bacillota bacterium]
MSIREDLLKEMEAMNEKNLRELLEYARWLNSERGDEAESLSAEEAKEADEAWAEYLRGESIPLDKVLAERKLV